MKNLASLLVSLCSILAGSLQAQGLTQNSPTAWAFKAGQSPVYHLRTIRQQPNARAVVTVGMDGTAACFSLDGKPIRTSAATGGFPFDMAAADIDGDGLDEVLVASGDGSLCAYDHDGTPLWEFARKPPLYQVCVACDEREDAIILTGGTEQVLYALSPSGTVIQSMKTEHCIRHLCAEKVLGNGRDYVAMATTSSGLTGILKLFLLDPRDLSVQWQHANLSIPRMNPGKRFFSMLITDLNKDGKDEVVLGGGWRENGIIHAYNDKGELLFSKADRRIPNIPYRMSLLRKVEVPGDEYVLGGFWQCPDPLRKQRNPPGDPDQLLSCSDLALVMKSPPAADYLKHGINGHRFSFPQDQDPEMVFSRMDSYWGGSATRADDFSGYAMNVRQRTCNFLPALPYGLVPIIPAHAANHRRFRQMIATDGEYFHDGNGTKHTAGDYKMEVESALRTAAARLPVTVVGQAHWSAVKLDEKHIRLTLIDPGYLDPSERAVEISFQHVKPTACFDILSGEILKPSGDRLSVTIPAGVFRIVDLELE